MDNKIEFNEGQRAMMVQARIDHLNMTEEEANAHVDYVEMTGEVIEFGAGSLLNYSHLQNPDGTFKDDLAKLFPGLDPKTVFEKTITARIEGYESDFVCYDTHYRGTPEKPGITIGVDKKEDGFTDGGLLITKIDRLDPNVAAAFDVYNLEKFKEREFPPNMPIYNFKLLEATVDGGQTKKGLVCVADATGPLYIYNTNNQFAEKDPKYAIARGPEGDAIKNEIMATAGCPIDPKTGDAKGKGSVTNADYARNLINDHIERDIPIPQRYIDRFMGILRHRATLEKTIHLNLEKHEYTGIKSNKLIFMGLFLDAATAHNQQFEVANDNKVDKSLTQQMK